MPDKDVRNILELHKKVVERFKEFETTDGETPPIVVLNELRYALRASMKLLALATFADLSTEQEETLHKSIQETHHALRNAYHDLVDGLLIQISRMMDDLIRKYPVASVNVLGDRRLEILKDVNKIEAKIVNSRGQGMDREQIYDEEIYGKWFEKIVEHYQFVDQVALLEVIREHDRLEAEDKSKTRRFLLNIVLTIFGIVVTVVVGILGIVLA